MLEKRPTPLQKYFFKIPLFMHKLGFGGWERLIGAQWMLIATTGRKTGKRRETLVDVMDYNPTTDTYYIEAAYGSHADWFKNIQANPLFNAQVGRRKFIAQAEILNEGDTGEILVQFFRRKPAYTRSVMAMVGMKFKDEDELRVLGKNLTLLVVKPQSPNRSSK
ncbi:MAG: nitroreductase family deazaflavin-dependent oxidoreductase [Anaerolineales bacterium]|jgi:deazaflavin-dependent oxidoreductase (nitroreductase family)|uniref:nitroreductase family deazaflavin-dependent oxidoreductase n=1 Tax=Candidatus Villigracilis vicinus TaxID=3140679 RepID=UPI003137216E|nr:nitroreductase family deazaflavin-dependent oxidoreductase [Anaerolineales bacterium]MBK7451706.1 nitroreductase family deazaflavin-dependent oxidoreductase [Anaerolineales bacterium]MBK9781610.1 nitroreductase family deazaflavin-dependent oxidoreductase [Anaerolineales bacterium]